MNDPPVLEVKVGLVLTLGVDVGKNDVFCGVAK